MFAHQPLGLVLVAGTDGLADGFVFVGADLTALGNGGTTIALGFSVQGAQGIHQHMAAGERIDAVVKFIIQLPQVIDIPRLSF